MQVLGSTRLLAAPNGSPVQGTTAHYLPYGDYRGSAPTATPLTERGYTGHHENREIVSASGVKVPKSSAYNVP